jgi:RNA polymerase sigma-70 factor (family 1)
MLKLKKPLTVIFKEIHAGEQIAFNDLFSAYYDRLLAFAFQYVKQTEVAEEITSELFLKIWLKREQMAEILNPEVYLYVSVKNAALNYLRGMKKHPVMVEDIHHEEACLLPADHQGLDLEKKELINLLDQAVAALPEQRRMIFKLMKEDGLKCKEVAAILGISTRTVESQVYKAVKTLADQLAPYLGYHPQRQVSRKQILSNLPALFFF